MKSHWGFPRGSAVISHLQCRRCRDASLIPGSGFPERGNGNPLSVILPGKAHGQRSLVGSSPWGHKRVRHDWVTKYQPHPTGVWRCFYKRDSEETQKITPCGMEAETTVMHLPAKECPGLLGTSKHLGGGKDRFSSTRFRGNMALQTPWFLTSSNYET